MVTTSDFKYAVRLLVKRPWFTLSTALMLAGGLSISIYTFAVLDTMLYRDLPLPDSDSIVKIGAGSWVDIEPLDAFELAEMRANADSFAELGAYRGSRALIAGRSVRSVESDWNIFDFTRVRPLAGRGFVSGDTSVGAEPVAVLSYRTWQTLFSADPSVIGEIERVNDRPTRIIGVMPEGYAFPENAELWLPLSAEDLAPVGYTGRGLETYARLRSGVSIASAEAQLTTLLRRLRQQHPSVGEPPPDTVAVLRFTAQGIVGTVMFGVLNLLSISILVLAAVNVSNLLLARTNERIREVGVRIALGAPRWRLVVQTTLENAILSALGGALAIWLASHALEVTNGFARVAFDGLPFWWQWHLDREVLAVAGLFLLLTVIAVSVLPVLCVTSVDPNKLLRDGTRTGGRDSSRISRELATIQVALISAVMVAGGAAAIIGYRTAKFDSGMNTDGVLTMRFELPQDRYATAAQRLSLYEALLTELRGTAGIEAAAIMQSPDTTHYAASGREYGPPDDYPGAWHVVLSETPSSLGPTLIQGRTFDSRDSATGQKTALVSASLASAQWPGESPIGLQLEVRLGDRAPELRTIVGVVSDVRFDPLGTVGIGTAAIYVPLAQFTGATARVLVRSFMDEARARGAMLDALARTDPAIAPEIERYDEALERITGFASTLTTLFAGCGIFAVFLAITGIYAMSRNSVILRSHEIGLRRALGASSSDVLWTFARQGVRQLARGLGVGGVLSALVLLVLRQGFSVGGVSLALLAAAVTAVVSASVLLSIYFAVRGVVRLEPSMALRFD